MCGIFGFITSEGRGPEISRLRRLALITQSRGDHAFGLAWLDEGGSIQTFKRPGPAQAHLDALDRCRHAVVVVGHPEAGVRVSIRFSVPGVAGGNFRVGPKGGDTFGHRLFGTSCR